jgi:hypothetical protein
MGRWTLADRLDGWGAELVEDVSVASSQQVLVRLDWSEVEQTSAHHVNQVLAQVGPPSSKGVPDGVYVALGSVSPPVIPPDDERRRARVAELADSVLRVTVHARVQLSREALRDLIQVLQTTADQYDASLGMAEAPGVHEQGGL